MLLEALRQINEWGVENIQEYCAGITAAPEERLVAAGFRVEASEWRASHLFGIRMPAGFSADELKAELERERIYLSIRGDAIRIAPHVYSSEADLHKLADCCLRVLG